MRPDHVQDHAALHSHSSSHKDVPNLSTTFLLFIFLAFAVFLFNPLLFEIIPKDKNVFVLFLKVIVNPFRSRLDTCGELDESHLDPVEL